VRRNEGPWEARVFHKFTIRSLGCLADLLFVIYMYTRNNISLWDSFGWRHLLHCRTRSACIYYSVWSGITCRYLHGCSHAWTTAGHYTIDHRPQLTRQWNKCVKHCIKWDSSLTLTYPTDISKPTLPCNAAKTDSTCRLESVDMWPLVQLLPDQRRTGLPLH